MAAENISYLHLERGEQPNQVTLPAKLGMEFIGTFFLAFVIAMSVDTDPNFAPIGVGFCLIGLIFMGGHLSGAHYNPAVSLAVWLRRMMTTKELVTYIPVQCTAATVAAYMAWAITNKTLPFAPGADYSQGQAFLAELLWTFLLVFTVLNVATTKSQEDNSFFGLAVGGIILGGAVGAGGVSGACFNPSLGTGMTIVDVTNGGTAKYIWIYWLAPMLGSVIASIAFRFVNAREYLDVKDEQSSKSTSLNTTPLLHVTSSSDRV